mmetsp:Transcript_35306/g.79776  ORF Transcript_35306/g.79776 Transcript_35306/m.79776 type:complete len:114 (+) Transcript_35306:2063-2404(+)
MVLTQIESAREDKERGYLKRLDQHAVCGLVVRDREEEEPSLKRKKRLSSSTKQGTKISKWKEDGDVRSWTRSSPADESSNVFTDVFGDDFGTPELTITSFIIGWSSSSRLVAP